MAGGSIGALGGEAIVADSARHVRAWYHPPR